MIFCYYCSWEPGLFQLSMKDSAFLPSPALLKMRPLSHCSGSGLIIITLWTSQTPLDLDLPDTSGFNWKDTIILCLARIYPSPEHSQTLSLFRPRRNRVTPPQIFIETFELRNFLRFGPSTCRLCLGSYHLQLHQTPSVLWLHRVPSSHRLPLGQSSLYLHHGLVGLPLHSVPPAGFFPFVYASVLHHTGIASGSLASPQTIVAMLSPRPHLLPVLSCLHATLAPPSLISTVGCHLWDLSMCQWTSIIAGEV